MQPPPVFAAGAHSPYRLAGKLHDHSQRPAGSPRAPLISARRMVSSWAHAISGVPYVALIYPIPQMIRV